MEGERRRGSLHGRADLPDRHARGACLDEQPKDCEARFLCKGGKGGLAVVYTKRDNARGYDLITIYDD